MCALPISVVGQLYDAQCDAIGGPIVINQNTNSSQRDPAVAALGEDRFIVVFETFSNVIDIQSGGISGVILNSDGSVDVDEFGINQRILGQQTSPDVAELANGNFVVVWRDSANTGDIRARIFEDDGTIVTDDIAVNDLTPGSQSRPTVAATADGFVVTWDTNQPNVNDPFGTFSVRMAAFDEDGVRLPLPDQINPSLPMLQSGDFQVNDEIDDEQSQGTVVGLNDGRSVFSYFDEESLQTFFEVRGPDGSVLLPETMALQDPVLMPPPGFIFSVSNVQMAATADGGFVMVGSAFVPGFPDADFALQIFDADLTPSALIPVNASSGTNDFEPLVAIADNGEIIVTWTSQVGSDRYEAKIRKFAADGDPITDTLSVPENLPIGFLSIGQLPTSVAVSSSGQIAIVGLSTDAESNTSGQDVYLSLLNSDLERTFGGALASDQEGSQRQAKVIALEDGNFLVVFKDNNNGAPTASGDDISGVIIDGNGDAVGDTFLINTTTNSTQEMPDVITLDDGRILVAWTDFDTAVGTNKDVNARLLAADGTPIGDEFILNPNQDLSEEGVALAAVGDGFAATWQAGIGLPEDNTVRGAIFDENLDPAETPLVLSNNEFGFLTLDQILDLQDIPLSGNPNDFFIDSFGDTALGTELFFFAGGVRYDPSSMSPEINNLAEGDQLTEIFEYTVENATGDQVTLLGSFQVQGFEDVM